jgi:peptide/nickel transport system permease protein
MSSTVGVAKPIFEEEVGQEGARWLSLIWRSLRSNRPAMVGIGLLGVIVVLAIIAPLIARYQPNAFDLNHLNENPTGRHWLGSDYLGRDIWARLLYGGRVSLPAGISAVVISFCIGVPMGLAAGYGKKVVDDILMRFVDMMLAFPGILLAIGIVSILGPSLRSAVIAVGVSGIPGYARIARGSTLEIRGNDFVLASIAQGANPTHIMGRHILPNIVAPLVVLATLNLSGAILATSALSFLGLGTQLPSSDWGTMLAEGYNYMFQSWAQVVFPGIIIVVAVLGINLFGDGLGEALNPRLRGKD